MEKKIRKISKVGLDLIKLYEGLRLEKYEDAVGKLTIGYGHLINSSDVFKHSITIIEAEKLLESDLVQFQDGINRCVTAAINQNQFDALMSFTFNLGIGSLQNSTLLLLLNRGQLQAASEQFHRWNKAGGRELVGLTRRRNAERNLFLLPS